ncbi:MAG: hypothetical protein HY320_10505 [Armatimonadetes bacterium]|nr:hypothetical protein [Armatimonadota bacterium]
MRTRAALVCTLALALSPGRGFAEAPGEPPVPSAARQTPKEAVADAEGTPEKKPSLLIHGFLQQNSSLRATRPVQLLKVESRLQLDLSQKAPRWGFLAKTDFVYDPAAVQGSSAHVDLREGYLTWHGRSLDLRIGKQIITWGVGDLIFLTDLFPKDWVSFITGAPIEYLKKGSTAVKANYYLDDWSLEAIFIPTFQRDTFPIGEKLTHFVPFPEATASRLVLPPRTLANAELALRASRMIGGYSTSLYLFRGTDPMPSFHFDPATTTVTVRPHRLNMVGASAQGDLRGTLLSGEFAYYDTEDSAGTDPEIANPSLNLLLAAERVLRDKRTASVQLFFGDMLHHGRYEASLPTGFPRQRQLRKTVTLRLRDSLRRDTFRPTVFLLYNLDDQDFFVKAEYEQDLTPGTWYALGVNLFGGKFRHTLYGQFRGNENIYFTLRRAF